MEKQFEEMEMLERIFYMQNLFDSDLIKTEILNFQRKSGYKKKCLQSYPNLRNSLRKSTSMVEKPEARERR